MWYIVDDGNQYARELFHRHYSYRPYADGRKPKLFVGPGEKLVLITKNCDALFIWRNFKSGDNQQGINCACFRNESKILSSIMILEAEKMAWKKWPEQRLYTYVNSKKIKSTNPGYCFIMAGWKKCGITKWNKLIILEKFPIRRIKE